MATMKQKLTPEITKVPEYVPKITRNNLRTDIPINYTNSDGYYQNLKKDCLRYTKKCNLMDKYRLHVFDNYHNIPNRCCRDSKLKSYCMLSVYIAFLFGLSLGIFIVGSQKPSSVIEDSQELVRNKKLNLRTLNSLKLNGFTVRNKLESTESKESENYTTVSFTGIKVLKKKHENHEKENIYPKGMTEDMKDILKDNKSKNIQNYKLNKNKTYEDKAKTVLFDNIFWGQEVEKALPEGYTEESGEYWEKYTKDNEIVKMEIGCGRMQNRLVTFKDGMQACVRYRQNTDQIQGEIFSFYVGKLLNLTNLAPSVVKVVDLKSVMWQNVPNEIAVAQWNNNRPVVLTQYIPNLESAHIPDVFKPSTRHLNKFDVLKIALKENDTIKPSVLVEKLRKNKKVPKDLNNFDYIEMDLNKRNLDFFVELAQWSDLIIFDYLTANLDRIVNNLFNLQWNANIMDGPAHNLARKMDSGLLLFLDNESGLLHGYRLLKKYNVYHGLMLDNLCVFRQTTVNALKELYDNQNVGRKLNDMFHKKNDAVIRDILPPLPEKNMKILHERIEKVLNQVEKCQDKYSKR